MLARRIPSSLASASARRHACGGCAPCPTAALLQKRKVESQPAKEAGGKRQPKALSAGFGFVECSTEASAKAAMRKLQAGPYAACLSQLSSQLSWSRGSQAAARRKLSAPCGLQSQTCSSACCAIHDSRLTCGAGVTARPPYLCNNSRSLLRSAAQAQQHLASVFEVGPLHPSAPRQCSTAAAWVGLRTQHAGVLPGQAQAGRPAQLEGPCSLARCAQGSPQAGRGCQAAGAQRGLRGGQEGHPGPVQPHGPGQALQPAPEV